jgi:hypothetical protein
LENGFVAVVAQQADGTYRLRQPQLVEWRRSWEIERSYFWDPMPASRLWLLLAGWLGLVLRLGTIMGRMHARCFSASVSPGG